LFSFAQARHHTPRPHLEKALHFHVCAASGQAQVLMHFKVGLAGTIGLATCGPMPMAPRLCHGGIKRQPRRSKCSAAIPSRLIRKRKRIASQKI